MSHDPRPTDISVRVIGTVCFTSPRSSNTTSLGPAISRRLAEKTSVRVSGSSPAGGLKSGVPHALQNVSASSTDAPHDTHDLAAASTESDRRPQCAQYGSDGLTGLPHHPHVAVRVAPDMFTRVGGTIAIAGSAPELRTGRGDERRRLVLPLGDFDVDAIVGGTTAAA